MNNNVRKILQLIDKQQSIAGNGYFRDEIDNINGLEEYLRHLSEAECNQLINKIKNNDLYRNRILSVALSSKQISLKVKEHIRLALE